MAAVTSVGETPIAAPAGRPRGMQASRRRRLNLFRYVVFTVFGLFFIVPLLAMARFSFEGAKLGTWSLSAFATIQAWENQIAYIVPQQISTALSSEVGLTNVNVADLLALGMVIMVAVVMTGYALLQRRAARWLR